MNLIRSMLLLTAVTWLGCATLALADEMPPTLHTPDKLQGADVSTPGVPAAPTKTPTDTPPVMDLTITPTGLWQRVRNDFGMPDLKNPQVQQQERWLLGHQDYLRNAVARSSLYLYYVMDEVEKRGMPSEIALLPFIESAYNPIAYSRAQASGIWQFIPSTGKRYGLEQNFWYDGRRDVIAATDAALDYLDKLYETFGNWDLALAAYNWGENSVARAIANNTARGRPADYLSLKMPQETRNYVPKLQAIKNIVADPERYGIDLADIPNRPYFATVTTNRHIDIQLAAKFAEVPVAEFMSLNPGYIRPVIRVSNEDETLLIPADKVGVFRANFEQRHDEPLVSWRTYTLKRDDRLSRVATKYGIGLVELKRINGISSRRKIGPGTTVLVPVKATDTAVDLPDLPAPPLPVFRRTRHHVSHHKGGIRTASTKKTNHKSIIDNKSTAALNSRKQAMLAESGHHAD